MAVMKNKWGGNASSNMETLPAALGGKCLSITCHSPSGVMYTPLTILMQLWQREFIFFFGKRVATLSCAEIAHALKTTCYECCSNIMKSRFFLEFISTSTLMYHLTRYDNMKSIRYLYSRWAEVKIYFTAWWNF